MTHTGWRKRRICETENRRQKTVASRQEKAVKYAECDTDAIRFETGSECPVSCLLFPFSSLERTETC